MLFKINATFPVTSYFLQTNSVVECVTKPLNCRFVILHCSRRVRDEWTLLYLLQQSI